MMKKGIFKLEVKLEKKVKHLICGLNFQIKK